MSGPRSYSLRTSDVLIQAATAGDLANGRQVAALLRFQTTYYPLNEVSY